MYGPDEEVAYVIVYPLVGLVTLTVIPWLAPSYVPVYPDAEYDIPAELIFHFADADH